MILTDVDRIDCRLINIDTNNFNAPRCDYSCGRQTDISQSDDTATVKVILITYTYCFQFSVLLLGC
jgi:hypothetical protein